MAPESGLIHVDELTHPGFVNQEPWQRGSNPVQWESPPPAQNGFDQTLPRPDPVRPLTCPSCRDDLAVADLRPGRFRIACPRCAASLIVSVPDQPEGEVTVVVEAVATPATAPIGGQGQTDAHAVRSGWVGRYRVVGPNRGRAWGVGPVVDLAVVRDRWRTDPRFVAAWTLDALAASELRHPNLAGPEGVDVAGDRVFAVGPAGDLPSLANPTTRSSFARNGRVAAVLHAARGLRHAHEQGVYARDLGLGSIRVDGDGLIRLTGLGVNRTPSDFAPPVVEPLPLAEPGAPPPPPTPPPIRPEVQVDLAGLGRILSTLVAGSSHDRAVPPGLATLIRRLGGDDAANVIDPRERFADAGAAVRALEAELGVVGPLQPIETEVEAFEAALEDHQTAPLAPLRQWATLGSVGLLGLIVVGLLALRRIIPAVGWLGFGGLIAVVLAGFRVLNARQRIRGRLAPVLAIVGRRDLITLGVAGLLGIGALGATHLLVTGCVVLGLAVGLAAVWHWGLDRPLAASRAESLDRLRGLVRGWRLLGFDEEAIRRHVANAGGSGWEEVFAALFGLESVAPARSRWGTTLAGGRRPRFAPLTGWWLGRLDRLVAGRRDERTRGRLEPIIERDLEARGTQTLTARRRSRRAAEALVAVLGQYRRSVDDSVGLPLADALRQAVARPDDFLTSPEIADDGEPAAWRPIAASLIEALGGSRARFLLGAACLAASFVWMEQNALVSYEEGKQAVMTSAVEGDHALAVDRAKRIGQKFVDGVARVIDAPDEAETMRLGVLSPAIAQHLNGFALATSGLILLVSSLVGGTRIIPVALIAAIIPLTPRLIVPSARPLDFASLVAMGVGVGVFVVGRMWARGDD